MCSAVLSGHPVERIGLHRLRFTLKCSLSHARLSSARHVRTSSSRWQRKRKGDKDEIDEGGAPFECARKLSPFFLALGGNDYARPAVAAVAVGCIASPRISRVLRLDKTLNFHLRVPKRAHGETRAYRINGTARTQFRVVISFAALLARFSCSR